jgi:hypothetical protein
MKKQEEEERLNCDAIDEKPRNYDFSQGYAEKWECYEAATCEKCNKPVMVSGEQRHNEVEDTECDGYIVGEGPMMNYYYPLPDFKMDVTEAAKKIVHLPLCIVQFTDTEEYALALTGGGMDLSWEICSAYMELGYWPPTHFRLPGFIPGMGPKGAMRVIKGMRESIKIRRNWLDSDDANLDTAEKRVIEVVKDRKKREKAKGKTA